MGISSTENHVKFLDRLRVYKQFGYDIEGNRKYILNVARPLYGRILEIGTGKGHMTLAIAREGYSLSSVDISREDQEIARLNLQYYNAENMVSLKVGDAENMSFPDRSFDIIISVNTVHHIKNPFKSLDEMIRLADPGGKIIVSEFTEEGLAIINKVHDSEGRRHDNSACIKMDEVGKYFRDRRFGVKSETNGFQQVLVISGKPC